MCCLMCVCRAPLANVPSHRRSVPLAVHTPCHQRAAIAASPIGLPPPIFSIIALTARTMQTRPAVKRMIATAGAAVNRHVPRCTRRKPRCRAAAGTGVSSTDRQTVTQQWSDLYSAFAEADKATAVDPTASTAEDSMTNTAALDKDTLSRALQLLQQAADAEDYETAAGLRDASLAWLGGWWRPISNPQARGINSSSSLLYVSHREANRWTGLLFTPADFMHFDLQGNCNSSELQMADMLQETRYGTPLFEVFVLPQQQLDQHQHLQQLDGQQQRQVQQLEQAAAAGSAADSPAEASQEPNTHLSSTTTTASSSSSSYVPVVVALQSVNRALNELLGVQASRRRQAPAPHEPKHMNQRLLLLVQPDSITAAAVHAGNDATLWTWVVSADRGSSSSSRSSAQQHASDTQGSGCAAAVRGPFRPADTSGGCRVGFTVDWHKNDHLRGPGTLARTDTDSFSFCRQPLPADVLSALCSSSSSDGSSWNGSNARLFRVDLQYMLPPSQPADPAAPAGPEAAEAAAAGAAGAGTAAAGTAAAGTAAAGTAQAGSTNQPASAAADDADAGAGSQRADRIAAELTQLLASNSSSGSGSSSGINGSLAALLTAAGEGTAPPGGTVSEAQQQVTVVEVPLAGCTAAAATSAGGAAAAGDSSAESAAGRAAVEFVRVLEPTAALSFGGWQVTASLALDA